MAFDKEQSQELRILFKEQTEHFDRKLDAQRSGIMADVRIVVDVELHMIKEQVVV